jgi:hypothetical protein
VQLALLLSITRGELTQDDYEQLFERPSDVPLRTERVEVALPYTGIKRRP